MLIRMASPMRRQGSTFIQLRKRIPKDLLGKAPGTRLAIPIGPEIVHSVISEKANEVTISLRTRDPCEAKGRQSAALAYLDSVWHSLRTGPQRLTHKQTAALAGEAYRALVSDFEEDPGEPSTWKQIVLLHTSAMAGGSETREKWFGPTVDQTLATHSLVVDADSRVALVDAVGQALALASVRVARNAGGDYSPDHVAERFPAIVLPKKDRISPRPNATGSQSIKGLVDGWWKEAKAAGKSISTYEAYERAARLLSEFLDHDDAQAVSEDDIIAFKEHRLSQGVGLKTITGSDLPGIRQLYAWAVANRKLTHNPAKGIKVAKVKRIKTRDRGFTESEAIAILSHALQHQRSGKGSKHLSNARKWVPWLCAYTGARVGEMVQLRQQDLRQEHGLSIITITPEAMTVKDAEYREVPLHPHLVELGFPEFVANAKSGYLFMAPSDESDKALRGAWRTTKNRVRDFVREVVKDDAVQPNHGWRHRFMTVGRDLGISKDVRFAITGHATKDQGDDYGTITNKAKAAALEKYPKYLVEKTRLK